MRSGFAVLIIVSIVFCASAFGYDWSTNPGDGSPENPYQISEPNQLIAIGSDSALLDKHFILTNDITFDPENNPAHVFDNALIAPDTSTSSGFQGDSFTGTFDGNAHKVINFKCISATPYFGLFGQLESQSDPNCVLVKNLVLESPALSSSSSVGGGLVGKLKAGTVFNCHTEKMDIEANGEYSACIGGLIGEVDGGTVILCSTEGDVRGYFSWIGGLVGYCNSGTIISCSTDGVITGYEWLDQVGGIAGFSNGTIVNSSSTAYVQGLGTLTYDIGGLVGLNQGKIDRCSYIGTTYGYYAVGGLAGENEGIISNSSSKGYVNGNAYVGGGVGLNYGTVFGCSSYSYIGIDNDTGGFVGWNDGLVRDSYAKGQIVGSTSIYLHGLGGFAGENTATIKNCYCSIKFIIQGEANHLGGFVGTDTNGQFEACFWNSDISIALTDIGDTGTNIEGIIASSQSQMQFLGTFTVYGWDFAGESVNGQEDIWTICDSYDFPRLSWENVDCSHGNYGGGTGTNIDPFLIYDVNDFLDLCAHSLDWKFSYKLMNHLDFQNSQIDQIGYYNEFYDFCLFTGSFNGNRCVLTNLQILNPLNDNVGLFGFISETSVIENISLTNINVSGHDNVGGLIGSNEKGRIINCHVNGNIFGEEVIGGIIGYNDYGMVISCSSQGHIVGSDEIGGLVGKQIGGEISRSIFEGEIEGTNDHSSGGGFVSRNSGSIRNSHAKATLEGIFNTCGGFIDYNSGRIEICSSSVTAGEPFTTESAGGFVEFNEGIGIINQCWSKGEIEAVGGIGGFASWGGGEISNSYSDVTITLTSTEPPGAGGIWRTAGGFCGLFGWGNISNCYSSAFWNGGNAESIGGFLGYLEEDGIIDHCFWNEDLFDLDNGYGTPLTDQQMKQQASFVGWDFVGESDNGINEIWRMCVDGVDYPRLPWEFAQNGDFACADGVDLGDLLALAEHWLLTEAVSPTTFNYACDANGDEQINLKDFGALSENW